MGIVIHVFGVISLIQIFTHVLAGGARSPGSTQALGITVPISIAYLIWLFF